jgi:hypothetical protein
VLRKGVDDGLLEVIGGGAGCIELTEQGERLATHGLLNHRDLPPLRRAQCVAAPTGLGGVAPSASGALEQSLELGPGQLGGRSRVGGARMTRASGRVIPPRASAKAARKPG